MVERTSYYRPTIVPPTLLGFSGAEPTYTPSPLNAVNDMVTKALHAKDILDTAKLMAQIAHGSSAPGPLAVINALFFLNSATPDVLKAPFTYYSGGFERPTPLTYPYLTFVALFQANLNQLSEYKERLNLGADYLRLAHAPESEALREVVENIFSVVEQGLVTGKANSWGELILTGGELIKKMTDAANAVTELGNSMFSEEKGTKPQPDNDLPYPTDFNYQEYNGIDFYEEGIGGRTAGLPSPNESNEFDG